MSKIFVSVSRKMFFLCFCLHRPDYLLIQIFINRSFLPSPLLGSEIRVLSLWGAHASRNCFLHWSLANQQNWTMSRSNLPMAHHWKQSHLLLPNGLFSMLRTAAKRPSSVSFALRQDQVLGGARTVIPSIIDKKKLVSWHHLWPVS